MDALAGVLLIGGGFLLAAGGLFSTRREETPAPGARLLVAAPTVESDDLDEEMSRTTAGLIGASAATAGAGAAAGAAVGTVLGLSVSTTLLVALVAAVFGALVPRGVLERRNRRRLNRIDNAIADVAALLAVTVRAGVGLDAALDLVTEEVEGPLREEFEIVGNQVRVGIPRKTALAALRLRAPTHNVDRLVQVLDTAEEMGGAVGMTLRALAEDCRARQFQAARERAASLPVQILFPVVFLIFPPMLIVLVGPAVSDIAKALGG